MSIKTPLRYNISSWEQLVECMSNYSNKLHIQVRKILQDTRLTGTVIDVIHEEFGSLFCYLVNGRGPLLASDDPLEYEMSCAEILKELERFGFLVTFDCKEHLPAKQIDFLRTVQKLGYDKIRILDVYSYTSTGVKLLNPHIVVFNVAPNPGWMDNNYSARKEEFLEALSIGSAFDLSNLSDVNRFHWDWLDFVGSLDDILAEYEESDEDITDEEPKEPIESEDSTEL